VDEAEGDGMAEVTGSGGSALAGIRVLDIGGSVATGYCGKLFADHGATVIDVEPPGGFATRRLPPHLPGAAPAEASALHRWLSAGKRSVQADLTTVPGRAALRRLAQGAQVLLHDYQHDELDALGASLPALTAIAPDLVLSAITWFGQDGPYANHAGSDGIVQSLAGMVRGIGLPGEPPLLPTGYQAQVIGGLSAFIGTLAQVIARELGNASGTEQLDTSILEANLCFTEVAGVSGHVLARDGLDVPGPRLGVNRFPPTYPLGVFPCRDGWIGITVLTPSQWHAFCDLLGFPELAHVPAYQTALGRMAASAELEAVYVPRLLEWSANELFNVAQARRIPLALVPTMEELFGVDQYAARGAFAPILHADAATLQGPVTPFRLYATPARSGPAPVLGEHNEMELGAHNELELGEHNEEELGADDATGGAR
jgi:crotonobetainyl-CoA:carnitine CoA-transferase CaiB-like acyl-CoA transferase